MQFQVGTLDLSTMCRGERVNNSRNSCAHRSWIECARSRYQRPFERTAHTPDGITIDAHIFWGSETIGQIPKRKLRSFSLGESYIVDLRLHMPKRVARSEPICTCAHIFRTATATRHATMHRRKLRQPGTLRSNLHIGDWGMVSENA